MTRMNIGDAYIHGSADGSKWTVGTKSVEMAFITRHGSFSLLAFNNKLDGSTRKYIAPRSAFPPCTVGAADQSIWLFQGANAEKTTAGGQPVVMLTLIFTAPGVNIRYHVMAYPGTSVLKLWIELENTGDLPISAAATPLTIPLCDDPATPFTHYWMVGGNSGPDHGMMHAATISGDYRRIVEGQATAAYMPWMALQRGGEPRDGWFMALEYLGNWRMSVARDSISQVMVSVEIPDLDGVWVQPGQTLALPAITLGAFAGTLDDMGIVSYDWQYRYLWDYTNMDFYARPKWAVPWFYCAQNLQEQFAERLACLDMDADLMRSVGFEMLWDDAGWSAYDGLPEDNYRSVFTSGYEGPDFRQTLHYLDKMGMRWLAWFTQRPSPGVMAGKVGSWGDFEWRSDAVSFPDWTADRDWRERILRFLETFPGSSFHTCSGGSTYSHTFDIPRYANTNYFSDGGRGPQTNYYFSYIEPPDKWVDIIEPWSTKGKYHPATARQTLTMVPFWGLRASLEDQELLRRDLDTYRFLRREGVAGRWSYTFHPVVLGDEEFYYAQRTSYDRTKACIILKHQAPSPVTIFPHGLLPGHRYEVEYDLSRKTAVRTGAELMAEGIPLQNHQPGELIYLNLPNRPRSGLNTIAPTAPGAVLSRRETNLGHTGVAVYWSPGTDDRWISAYEVRRGDRILGKVSTGNMYFDHADGWDTDARYAVRTLNGDGNESAWTEDVRIDDEPLTACALGGLFPAQGRQGWSAETTTDGITYTPMNWVSPPKTASADEGGTPNQPGGIEGCWEGPGGGRLGRAWMQASLDACCVRTWIASAPGTVRIVSRVMKEWYSQAVGAPQRVRILQGAIQVWPASGWAVVPLNDLVGVMHDITLDVAAGDPIRFMLDRQTSSRDANIRFGNCWTVFGPCELADPAVPTTAMERIPETLNVGDKRLARHVVNVEDGLLDLAPLLGGAGGKRTTYVFIPLHVSQTDIYQLGIDLTGWHAAWLDGKGVSDTSIGGNDATVANRENHHVSVNMEAGNHVLAIRCISNDDGCKLDAGVPLSAGGDIIAWMPAITYIDQQPAVRAGSIVRINCGMSRPYTDRFGNRWSADCGFQGGHAVTGKIKVDGADDPALYLHVRQGKEFTYRIPVEMGLYTVRLRFTEPKYQSLFARPCNIEINGREVLRNFDICQDARGFRKAHDRVFRCIVPNADGNIILRFSGGFEPGQATDEAIIQAIEILPETKPVVRINCGSDADFVDWNSNVWNSDHDLLAGRSLQSVRPVTQASPTLYDQALYQTAKSGREVAYTLTLPPGLYTVHLKFAELWLEEAGKRPMNILVNDRTLWTNWDPYAAAGEANMAIDLRAQNITPDSANRITICTRAVGEYDAILQGIEAE